MWEGLEAGKNQCTRDTRCLYIFRAGRPIARASLAMGLETRVAAKDSQYLSTCCPREEGRAASSTAVCISALWSWRRREGSGFGDGRADRSCRCGARCRQAEERCRGEGGQGPVTPLISQCPVVEGKGPGILIPIWALSTAHAPCSRHNSPPANLTSSSPTQQRRRDCCLFLATASPS